MKLPIKVNYDEYVELYGLLMGTWEFLKGLFSNHPHLDITMLSQQRTTQQWQSAPVTMFWTCYLP